MKVESVHLSTNASCVSCCLMCFGPASKVHKQMYIFFHFPPPTLSVPMATASFLAFIRQAPVTISLDASSDSSHISPVLVYKLDLPCSFGISGTQLATINLHIPTDDSDHHSCLSFSISYGIASDIILGADWLAACKPILLDDWSHFLRLLPSTVNHLTPPHLWHPTKYSFFVLDTHSIAHDLSGLHLAC